MPSDAPYAIADLARLTGLNVRTIRYYLAQGLLPASGESGPGAHYGEGHLDRLRLTKRLQAQHLPLAEIRARLAELTDDDVAGLVAAERESSSTPTTSALDYIRGVLGASEGPTELSKAMLTGKYPPTPAFYPADSSAPAAPTAAVPPPVPPAAAASSTPAGRLLAAARLRMPATRVAEQAMPLMRDIPAPTPPPIEPQSVERSQWERLSLGPNVELHIRRPLSRLEQRRVERLITIARQVLHEDRS